MFITDAILKTHGFIINPLAVELNGILFLLSAVRGKKG